MSDIVIVFGGAFIVAIIICVVIVKKELEKDKKERISKSLEVSRKLEEEALNEALSYGEDDEGEEDDDEDDDY